MKNVKGINVLFNQLTQNSTLNQTLEIYRSKTSLLLIVYRVLLEIIYLVVITTVYEYGGFLRDYNFFNHIISILIFLLSFPVINKFIENKTPSKILVFVWLLIGFIPGTILFAYQPTSLQYILYFTLYWFFLSILALLFPEIKLKINNSNIKEYLFYSFLVLMVFTVLYISWKYTGFRINFSLLNVYDLRTDSTTFKIGSFFRYILSFSRTTIPIYFVYFLHRKKYLFATVLFAVQWLSFSIDGSKTVVFALILCLLVYFLYFDKFLKNILIYFNIFNVLAFLEYVLLKTFFLTGFVIRRVYFVPQLLNYYFFDFFSKNEFDFFRQGIMGRLGFESPYNQSIPHIIGAEYAGVRAANNGLFSDAFANMGFAGMIILPIMIVIALKLLDIVTQDIDIRIVFPSLIMICVLFISSSFFTIMMTHGFIAYLVVFYLMPRDKQSREEI